MKDPFFEYIVDNLHTVSNSLYGFNTAEKRYPNSNYAPLVDVSAPDTTYAESLQKRKSIRSFSEAPLSSSELSGLLKFSLARDEEYSGIEKFPFPSGGKLYPLETYLLIQNVEGFQTGLYHYSGKEHTIAFLKKQTLSLQATNKMFGGEFFSQPHVLVLMTMVKSRCVRVYGSRSYILSHIEAGHRGQNIYLSAASFGLGCCALGGGTYDTVNELLEVDGDNENYIYAIAIGKI